jgi:hypothetical protein
MKKRAGGDYIGLFSSKGEKRHPYLVSFPSRRETT